MLNGQRVLAVVPARGGSRGIPLKNLRPVLGVPIVARVGRVVTEVPEIDRTVVSTDHEEIARVAEEAGILAPFRRPPELSGDRVGDAEVLRHALSEMERLDGVTYDIVVMLQPTSPLRRPGHVSAAINKLVDEGWDSVWTLSETDSKAHPLKQLMVESGALEYYDPAGARVVARQELRPLYHRNGVAYAIRRQCLIEQGSIRGDRAGALLLEGHFVSIDTEFDIALVEFLMQREALA